MTEAQLRTRRYGLESLITEFSKSIFYLILFTVFGFTVPYLISYFTFAIIRGFSGGFHANSYWGCFIISLTGFIAIIFTGYYIEIPNYVILILLFISVCIDLLIAPVSHPNKPNKDILKHRKFKIISGLLMTVLGGAAFLLPGQYKVTVIASILLVAVMQVFGRLLNNKTHKEDRVYEHT